LSDNPSETRLPHLESIRGVAALAVAIHHAVIVYPVDPSLSWLNMVLLTIGNGGGGIFIFFILSGYVLTLSLERTDLSPLVLLGFYVRRFFRIWPALAFAALFALIVVQIFRMFSVPPEARQFISWAAPTFHFSDAAANMVLMSTKINGPTWTIWTEVCWSALLPALVPAPWPPVGSSAPLQPPARQTPQKEIEKEVPAQPAGNSRQTGDRRCPRRT